MSRSFRRAAGCLVLLGALSHAPNALAADDADEADFHFRRGAGLYAKRDFEGALGEFYSSNRLVKNRNVAINIGRCLEQLGRVYEAHRVYASLLDEKMPEEDRKALDASLERLAPKVALIEVVSEPPGAVVYVDRKDLGALGTAPRTLALQPRKLKVLLELDGFRPQEREVELTLGTSQKVRVVLERIHGRVALDLEPAAAAVRLDAPDGPEVTAETLFIPGRHTLFAEAPGHLPQQLPIDVLPDQTVPARIRLAARPAPTGALVVRANVDGALVIVDGKEAGFTPAVIEGVGVGEHTIELDAQGRERVSKKTQVAEGERSFVEAKLRYSGAVVEAASKTREKASDAAASITVISREELRAFGYQTLAEAMRAVRGLYLTDDRIYSNVGFRGFSPVGDTNNRLLILVDGHTVFDPWLAQGFAGRELDVDLEEVERIEVVRGAVSAVYGTGAVFGVINVVKRKESSALAGDVSMGVNSYSGQSGRVTGSGVIGPMTARISAAIYDAAGEPAYVLPSPLQGKRVSVGNDGERAGHVDLKLTAGGFTLQGAYNTRRKASPSGQYDTVFGEPGINIDSIAFLEARYEHTFSNDLGIFARAFTDLSRYEGRFIALDDTTVTGSTFQRVLGGANSAGAEARVRLPEFFKNRLTLGTEYGDRFRFIQEIRVGDATPQKGTLPRQRIFSAYLQDDVKPLSWLGFSGTLRIDDWIDGFGVSLNPRLAAVAHAYEGATTKLLFGRSFRAPSSYERFFADGTSQVAAPNLKPEVGYTAELEHTHSFTDEVSATASVFFSQYEQLIDLGRDDVTGLIQYQNDSGRFRSTGAELEVRWSPSPLLLLEGTYAYQRAFDLTGTPALNSPNHIAVARVMAPIAQEFLQLGTEAVYVGPRRADGEVPGEIVVLGENIWWNATLSGGYAPWRLRWSASAVNLLDRRFQLPGGALPPGVQVTQLGRSLRGTLGITF